MTCPAPDTPHVLAAHVALTITGIKQRLTLEFIKVLPDLIPSAQALFTHLI